jgi:hypothetical protein
LICIMADFIADPGMTLAAARDLYFKVNNFGSNGGYDEPWVEFKLGSIPLPFPNTPARIRAVRFHDLHHSVTGYSTDILGEFEISGWEVGSGCADFAAAWALNLSGMVGGVLSAPRRTWRAYVRGRHSRNFYRSRYDSVIGRRVGELQHELGLDVPAPGATAADAAMFALALAAGSLVGLLMLLFIVPAVPAGLYFTWRRRQQRAVAASSHQG